jgi:hypothetical protein
MLDEFGKFLESRFLQETGTLFSLFSLVIPFLIKYATLGALRKSAPTDKSRDIVGALRKSARNACARNACAQINREIVA